MTKNKNCRTEPVLSIPIRDYFLKLPANSTEVGKAMPGQEVLVILHIITPSQEVSLLPTSFLTSPKRVRRSDFIGTRYFLLFVG